jgi:hypothetical protein
MDTMQALIAGRSTSFEGVICVDLLLERPQFRIAVFLMTKSN